jgi:hypothetical protein
LVRWPHHLPVPTPLKTITRAFIILFCRCLWSHQPYSLTFISFILPLSPQVSLLHSTYFIINSKVSVQRGFSKYLCCEYTLFWSAQPLPLLSLAPSLLPLFFNSFQYISLYPVPSQMLRYCWCSIILFFFSFLKL